MVLPDAASKTRYVSISPTMYSFVKIAVNVKRKATKKKSLDYKKATSYFKSSKKYGTDWRRRYAAGWLIGGGTIKNISKAERKKVNAEKKKAEAISKKRLSLADSRFLPDGTNCQGVTKYVEHPKTDYPRWWYWDSCKSNLIVRNAGISITIVGVLGPLTGNPGVTALTSLYSAGAGITIPMVGSAQANSKKSAIIIKGGPPRKYEPTKPTKQNPLRYQLPVRIDPQ